MKKLCTLLLNQQQERGVIFLFLSVNLFVKFVTKFFTGFVNHYICSSGVPADMTLQHLSFSQHITIQHCFVQTYYNTTLFFLSRQHITIQHCLCPGSILQFFVCLFSLLQYSIVLLAFITIQQGFLLMATTIHHYVTDSNYNTSLFFDIFTIHHCFSEHFTMQYCCSETALFI